MPFKIVDVESQYQRDKNLKKEDVKALAEWLKKQPHLPKITELQLVFFLHSCYYRIEPTKKTIDNYFTIRTMCSDLFGVPSADSVETVTETGFLAILPELTADGDRVLLGRLMKANPDTYDYVHQVNMSDAAMILNQYQDGVVNGLIVVLDMVYFGFGHLAKVNLAAARKFMHFVQEALPMRLKAIHVINAVPIIDKVMALLRPFMKKELVELINIHTAPNETFYRTIPKRIMPSDYGGEAPSCVELRDILRKNLLDNMELLRWLDSQKVDESKRREKLSNLNSIMGIEGSFKKLELD